MNNRESSDITSLPQNQSNRIEFIDAMRGFTIFLVVLNHVALYCLNISESTPTFYHYFIQVEMPMFCFISGFVFYRDGNIWSLEYAIRFFKKKIPVLLFSPLLFFVVYMHVKCIPFSDGFFTDSKYGYWYTYVLMQFFAVYAIVHICFKDKWIDMILIAIGLCSYPSNWPPMVEHLPIKTEILSFLSFRHWGFFFYFVIGVFVRKYFFFVQKWLDGKWPLCAIIGFYLLGNAFEDLIPVGDGIKQLPLDLAGLCILFAFFRNNQQMFSKKKRVGNIMQYVGRRTLDIYLVHFFCCPKTSVLLEFLMSIRCRFLI